MCIICPCGITSMLFKINSERILSIAKNYCIPSRPMSWNITHIIIYKTMNVFGWDERQHIKEDTQATHKQKNNVLIFLINMSPYSVLNGWIRMKWYQLTHFAYRFRGISVVDYDCKAYNITLLYLFFFCNARALKCIRLKRYQLTHFTRQSASDF